jgi:hypothetical protein
LAAAENGLARVQRSLILVLKANGGLMQGVGAPQAARYSQASARRLPALADLRRAQALQGGQALVSFGLGNARVVRGMGQPENRRQSGRLIRALAWA